MSVQRYRFGELTHRGPLGSLRAGQVALAAGGLVGAIAIIDVAPTAPGVLLAFTGLATAVLAATIPVAGRTLEQWFPAACAWLIICVTGRSQTVSASAGASVTVRLPAQGRPLLSEHEPSPPPPLRAVRIVAVPYRGAMVGAVSERRGRRLTAVLVSRAPGFALADQEEQQQRLAAWAGVLSACAHGPIRRIGWVQRTAPAQGDGLARWLHEQKDPTIDHASEIARSYLELMAQSAQAVCEHDVLLCVQVDTARLRRDDGDTLAHALLDACERLAAGLQPARVHTDRALSPGGLARVLRVAYDPYQHAQLAALRAAGASDELAERGAWPAATREHWGSYQADAAHHATFEIAGWPRSEVGPAFLSPLLEASEQLRAIAVWFEPLDPRRSLRQAEADVTRQETDRRQRQRLGQIDTARQQQAQDATRRREQELAAGHSEVRLAGYITVTGHNPDALERACEQTITLAARSHLQLHRLYGQQAQAFTFTLPLCRGLK